MQQDKDAKHTAKQGVFRAKYWLAESVLWPQLNWACVVVVEDQTAD